MINIPRPRRRRRVKGPPNYRRFAPRGFEGEEEEVLNMDEFEAIRLKDLKGFSQGEAAKKMDVSQPTFNRILKSAREKIAKFLVEGKPIRIEGGNYKMVKPGMGRKGGFAKGPAGKCVCPNCDHKIPHKRGVPCYEKKCPECGTKMTRA